MKIDLVNTFWPHWPGMNTEVLYVQVCLALAELAVLGHVFTFEPQCGQARIPDFA